MQNWCSGSRGGGGGEQAGRRDGDEVWGDRGGEGREGQMTVVVVEGWEGGGQNAWGRSVEGSPGRGNITGTLTTGLGVGRQH